MFEEGNSFTMEALQQQLDQLSAVQDYQVGARTAFEMHISKCKHVVSPPPRGRGSNKCAVVVLLRTGMNC